ncbi:MAG TPA: carbohydrate ABC transporter permease, partial [Bacilli bacterium]
MKLNTSEIIFKILAYAFVGIFALLALYPIVYAFSASISGKVPYELGEIVLFPKEVNFLVYKEIIYDKQFWIAYTNTLFYTVFGTLWSMFISVTGAYVLAKKKLIGQRVFNFLLVFTMWFSAGMIPHFLNYKAMGVDNRWGIVIAFGVQAY